tara:strand:- start:966 stop:1124 length:159 start_codon:yes stop_codon:yes gene_type:complete
VAEQLALDDVLARSQYEVLERSLALQPVELILAYLVGVQLPVSGLVVASEVR